MPGVVSLQLSRQVFLMAERPGCRLLGPGKRGGPGPDRAAFICVICRAVGGIGLIGLQRIGPLEVIVSGEHFGRCPIRRRQSQRLFHIGENFGRHAPGGLWQKKRFPIGKERRQICVFSV